MAAFTSLLWPSSVPSDSARLSPSVAEDLHLEAIVAAIVGGEGARIRLQQREHFARETLNQLCLIPALIGHRQAALQDLLDDETLNTRLTDILPRLEELADATTLSERYRPAAREALENIVRRLAELELFVEVMRELYETLAVANLRSTALTHLRDHLQELVQSETFGALERDLPELRATLTSVRSMTIGVNLGPDLAPQSATILGFATAPVQGRQALLGRLLGDSEGSTHGLTPLRRVERTPEGWQNDVGRDMRQLLQDVASPVAAALRRYAAVSISGAHRLGPELGFLLGGVRLVQRLRDLGLPTCRPEILPIGERCTELDAAYDPGLALQSAGQTAALVTNPVVFDAEDARVWVLSGPNRSGKTTFTRAVGLAHILTQAGLHVPARSARLSPVDAVYTHFPSREAAQPGMGRLDEEAERLAAIFQQATPLSLVLLNEALAGTSTFEALDLASGVVRGLRVLGARAIYVTHLHELAASVGAINASTQGESRVGSLVSEPDAEPTERPEAAPRTFRIRPGPPHGQSFAAQIAEQHGISFPQIVALLRQRGLHP